MSAMLGAQTNFEIEPYPVFVLGIEENEMNLVCEERGMDF